MVRHLLWILVSALGACGSSVPQLALSTSEQLAAARDLFEGERTGDAWLQRDVQVRIETGRDAGRVTSTMRVRAAVARYAEVGQGAPVLEVLAPAGATVTEARAHETREGVDVPAAAPTCVPSRTLRRIDPTQLAFACTLPTPAAGRVVEALVTLEVRGTVASDAQWLGQTGGPTGELLVRYDLPGNAVGAFQLIGAEGRPVVTQQNGRTVIALYTKHIPRRDGGTETNASAAYTRYATRSASPSGYQQDWSSTWTVATGAYQTRLVDASDGLSQGFGVPFQPSQIGPPALTESFHWVQSRPVQKDAQAAPWDATRELPDALQQNDLNATDQVHLLHWILSEANIPHRFAAARRAHWPRLDPTFPVPAAFDVPLLFADGVGLLDPACADCTPGQVRPDLRGGQAIVFPVDLSAGPLTDLAP